MGAQYDVLAAPGGARALQIAAGDPKPDLILLDVLMPEMDGYEVFARLRDDPAGRDIPVIFVTGKDSTEDEEKGLKLGAVDYIAKPYRAPVILARVQTQLELKQARDRLANRNIHLESEVTVASTTLSRLASIVELSDDAIVSTSLDGVVESWNRAAERLFGYSAKEAAGRGFKSLIVPPGYDGEAARKFDAIRRGKHIKHFETVRRRKDGTLVEVSIVGAPILDADGRVVGASVNLRDITDRKLAEDMLRQSEAFIRSVLDSLPLGIAVNSVDPPVVFSYMNDNFPLFYRTTREKLADPDAFWEAVYEDAGFRQQIRTRVLEDCASGDAGRMHWDDVPITRKGQETSFISARNIPLPDKLLMVSVVWDVTERKRAEQILKDEKAFSDTLIRSIPDIFFLIDSQGCLLRWNKKLEELTGLTPEEMARVNVLTYVHEEDRPFMVRKLQQVIETGSAEAETRLNLKNGTRNYALTGNRTETRLGMNIIGTGIDITERKHAEEQLRNMADKYFAVFESSSDAIFLLDRDGHVFDCNRATLHMFAGAGQTEFAGQNISRFFPPAQPGGEDSNNLAREYIATAYRSGSVRFEWMHRRLDGSDFPCEVFLTVMELDHKPMLLATVRDISERKAAQVSEQRYRRLFESAKDGILILDGETGQLLDANRSSPFFAVNSIQ